MAAPTGVRKRETRVTGCEDPESASGDSPSVGKRLLGAAPADSVATEATVFATMAPDAIGRVCAVARAAPVFILEILGRMLLITVNVWVLAHKGMESVRPMFHEIGADNYLPLLGALIWRITTPTLQHLAAAGVIGSPQRLKEFTLSICCLTCCLNVIIAAAWYCVSLLERDGTYIRISATWLPAVTFYSILCHYQQTAPRVEGAMKQSELITGPRRHMSVVGSYEEPSVGALREASRLMKPAAITSFVSCLFHATVLSVFIDRDWVDTNAVPFVTSLTRWTQLFAYGTYTWYSCGCDAVDMSQWREAMSALRCRFVQRLWWTLTKCHTLALYTLMEEGPLLLCLWYFPWPAVHYSALNRNEDTAHRLLAHCNETAIDPRTGDRRAAWHDPNATGIAITCTLLTSFASIPVGAGTALYLELRDQLLRGRPATARSVLRYSLAIAIGVAMTGAVAMYVSAHALSRIVHSELQERVQVGVQYASSTFAVLTVYYVAAAGAMALQDKRLLALCCTSGFVASLGFYRSTLQLPVGVSGCDFVFPPDRQGFAMLFLTAYYGAAGIPAAVATCFLKWEVPRRQSHDDWIWMPCTTGAPFISSVFRIPGNVGSIVQWKGILDPELPLEAYMPCHLCHLVSASDDTEMNDRTDDTDRIRTVKGKLYTLETVDIKTFKTLDEDTGGEMDFRGFAGRCLKEFQMFKTHIAHLHDYKHGSVLGMYGWARNWKGQLSVITECCSGCIADELRCGKSLSLTDVLSAAECVSQAVLYIHVKHGAVHCDIGPRHVARTPYRGFRLTGFGRCLPEGDVLIEVHPSFPPWLLDRIEVRAKRVGPGNHQDTDGTNNTSTQGCPAPVADFAIDAWGFGCLVDQLLRNEPVGEDGGWAAEPTTDAVVAAHDKRSRAPPPMSQVGTGREAVIDVPYVWERLTLACWQYHGLIEACGVTPFSKIAKAVQLLIRDTIVYYKSPAFWDASQGDVYRVGALVRLHAEAQAVVDMARERHPALRPVDVHALVREKLVIAIARWEGVPKALLNDAFAAHKCALGETMDCRGMEKTEWRLLFAVGGARAKQPSHFTRLFLNPSFKKVGWHVPPGGSDTRGWWSRGVWPLMLATTQPKLRQQLRPDILGTDPPPPGPALWWGDEIGAGWVYLTVHPQYSADVGDIEDFALAFDILFICAFTLRCLFAHGSQSKTLVVFRASLNENELWKRTGNGSRPEPLSEALGGGDGALAAARWVFSIHRVFTEPRPEQPLAEFRAEFKEHLRPVLRLTVSCTDALRDALDLYVSQVRSRKPLPVGERVCDAARRRGTCECAGRHWAWLVTGPWPAMLREETGARRSLKDEEKMARDETKRKEIRQRLVAAAPAAAVVEEEDMEINLFDLPAVVGDLQVEIRDREAGPAPPTSHHIRSVEGNSKRTGSSRGPEG